MRVMIAGAGLMGAQIGVEYALGGHDVLCVARHTAGVGARVDHAFALAAAYDLAASAAIAAAQQRLAISDDLSAGGAAIDLVVESIVEELEQKIALLRRCAALMPRAILASNTSALSITTLGAGTGAPERTIGTHYWNPPLLMPLVEVVLGQETAPATVATVTDALRALGKRPVLVERDVPGFVWNRLQLALLREAVAIVEQGVATPETVDTIVRDGLARRWTRTGPFATAALGGAETFRRIAAFLLPHLSDAQALDDLDRWLEHDPATLTALREQRDAGLAAALRQDQAAAAGGEPTDSERQRELRSQRA